jgi:hypothetical protein
LKVLTPSGNSGHIVVLKAWIRKETIVKLKEKKRKIKVQRRRNNIPKLTRPSGVNAYRFTGIREAE